MPGRAQEFGFKFCGQPGREILMIYWIISCTHCPIIFLYSSCAGRSRVLEGEKNVTYWQCMAPFPFRRLQPCKLDLMVSTQNILSRGSVKECSLGRNHFLLQGCLKLVFSFLSLL